MNPTKKQKQKIGYRYHLVFRWRIWWHGSSGRKFEEPSFFTILSETDFTVSENRTEKYRTSENSTIINTLCPGKVSKEKDLEVDVHSMSGDTPVCLFMKWGYWPHKTGFRSLIWETLKLWRKIQVWRRKNFFLLSSLQDCRTN